MEQRHGSKKCCFILPSELGSRLELSSNSVFEASLDQRDNYNIGILSVRPGVSGLVGVDIPR